MSGGFFRGTSADQDTRFSNKQAKLLKTQKFPSELDHPVDMTKVKLDVMRPWIANRVTELLGFEDEVLINFVYGLLDGKEVDGKQVQIQLTGFMEKNTGKFMKELWSLLRSAQSNASGVPQQFLDAKEEETRKKKAETDRIAQEIQRRREREGRDMSRDKSRMGAEADTRSNEAATDLVSKHQSPRTSDGKIEEERRRSPRLNRRSPPSAERSLSKSKSRSYSRERPRSRSRSVSSGSSQRSPPRRRQHHSPVIRVSSPVRSVSPRRRRSPSPRKRSPFGRRRSTSRPRRRSPSPRRRSPLARQRSPSRSPMRRRSPSPVYRRSRSPVRRRSPLSVRHRMRSPFRRRSPSPPRRRSPSPSRRRRSRSPLRRRSPSAKIRRSPFQTRRSRSPLRLRPPIGRTSVSPTRHSSSTPPRRSPDGRSLTLRKRSASPSPKRRPVDSRISTRQRNRSRTPGSRSPLYRAHRNFSRDRDDNIHTNGFQARKHWDELLSERGRRFSPDKEALRRDGITSHDYMYKVSDSLGGKNNSALKRQSPSSSASPIEQSRRRLSCHDSPEASKEENEDSQEREDAHHSTRNVQRRSKHSPIVEPKEKRDPREKVPSVSASHKPCGSLSPVGRSPVFNQQKEPRSELNRHSQSPSYRGRVKGKMGSIDDGRASNQTKKHEKASVLEGNEFKEQSRQESSHRDSFYAKDGKRYKLEEEKEDKDTVPKRQSGEKYRKNGIQRDEMDDIDSDSENADAYNKKDKRKRKKSSRHRKYSDSDSSDDDAENDSRTEDKKEARRRKKEERKKRKEEKRRRKEERRRRKEEGRGGKHKGRSLDTTAPPTDLETPPLYLEKNCKNSDEAADDFARQGKRGSSHQSDTEMESEQKMLEIELRKKALDSLRAKKAINP